LVSCSQTSEMKKIALLLLGIGLQALFAQSSQLPRNAELQSLDRIHLAGYKLIEAVEGDLNKDQHPDRALVFQGTDPALMELNEGMGMDTLDLNPRILAIYFYHPPTNSYQLILQADSFIIRREIPTMDEPFEMIRITDRGVLEIKLNLWYSSGSWYMSEHTYKFRYQNSRFALIGYDGNETHRGSGETTSYSINFTTRKMTVQKGSLLKTVEEHTEWKTFRLPELRSLEDLGKPFRWEFQGIYL